MRLASVRCFYLHRPRRFRVGNHRSRPDVDRILGQDLLTGGFARFWEFLGAPGLVTRIAGVGNKSRGGRSCT